MLTDLEKQALRAAILSSAANGHDFGFVEDIVADMKPMKPQAVGGVVASLKKKGFFSHIESVTVNRTDTYTQFVFENVEAAKAAAE